MHRSILSLLIACSVFVPSAHATDGKAPDLYKCRVVKSTPANHDRDPIIGIIIDIRTNPNSILHISRSGRIYARSQQYNQNFDDTKNGLILEWDGPNNKKPWSNMAGWLSYQSGKFFYVETIKENNIIVHEMVSVCEGIE